MTTDAQRPPNKRRKRKGSNSGSGANSAPPVPSKKRSPGPNFSLASQVVVSHSFLVYDILRKRQPSTCERVHYRCFLRPRLFKDNKNIRFCEEEIRTAEKFKMFF